MDDQSLSWITVKRTVKNLIPYEHNPRILTKDKEEQLKRSLEKFNLVEIPVINTDDVVIAGHQRLKIMFILGRGDEEIDVRFPSRPLTEKELKEYNITSNLQVGIWDVNILEEIFADIDLDGLGLNLADIDTSSTLLKELEPEEEQTVDPTPPKEPITITGDIYELISSKKSLIHKIMCGDSRNIEDWNKIMDGKKADILNTDPPYNVDYQGGTKDKLKIENDKQSDADFKTFLFMFYSAAFEILKEGAPAYIFHADTEGVNFREQFTNAGFKLSECLVWVKSQFVMGRQDYHWQHEPILYGWKTGAAHHWYSDRKQSTVLNFDKPERSEDHPTMKPIPLLNYLNNNSSKVYAIVIDGFLGSGSTLISCEQTLKHCRGMELDPRFSDVEVKRWVKYMRDNDLPYTIKKNNEILTDIDLNGYFTEH